MVGPGCDGEGARVRHGEELVGRAAQVGGVELVHAHDGVAPVLLGERQPVAAPHEGEEEAALLVRVRVRVRVDPNRNPKPNEGEEEGALLGREGAQH